MSWAGKLYYIECYTGIAEVDPLLLGFKKNVNRATTQVMMKTGMQTEDITLNSGYRYESS